MKTGAERVAELALVREACLMLGKSKGMKGEEVAKLDRGAVARLMLADEQLEMWHLKMSRKFATMASGDVVMEAFRCRMVRRDLVGAAAVLWPKHVFTGEPWACGKIWKAMDEGAYVSVLGCGAAGKSFSVAVRLFMEWAADPEATRVDLVSKNDEKIKKLFADFVNLHRQACVVLPGAVEAETISTDKMGGWGIFRNLIRAGEESSSVLKGTHEKARLKQHPVFGFRTARYVMIDEAQDVAPAVFDDIGNILLSLGAEDGASCGGRRMRQIVMTANPSLPNSRYGEQCKPEGGWAAIDVETVEDWTARLGARCVRIDALKTENVRQGREVFPGMIKAEGVATQLAICDGNDNHPLYWTYVRGFFPPEGALSTLIPMRWLSAAEGEWLFEGPVTEYCGVDVARLGGDSPAMAFGRAVAWRDYSGHEYKLAEPGWRVQLDAVMRLPQGDTQEVADDIMRRLRDTGVRPESCAVDMTGSSGVYDLLVHQWKSKKLTPTKNTREEPPTWHRWADPAEVREVAGGSPVIGVSYSRKPTLMKVAAEDSVPARELYTNMASEIWYALSKYFELGYLRYGKGVGRKTLEEISTRKGGLTQGKGKKLAVESKEAHKKRLAGASCDEADAATLFLQSVRLGTEELQPKAKDTQLAAEQPGRMRQADGTPWAMKDESGFSPPTIEEMVRANEGTSGHGGELAMAGTGADADPARW